MSPVQTIVLALVQAATEFLPISSSGHLILIPWLLGWSDQGLTFDIATNTGTLLAVAVYFRRDLRRLLAGLLAEPLPWRTAAAGDGRFAWLLALGTVPAVIAGLLIHDWVATQGRNPRLIAVNAIAYGLLLLVVDRFARAEKDERALGWLGALAIGAAQALALVPGTSRSGITMTAALLLGLTRPAAARFSFLLSVPIGIAAGAKDLWDHGAEVMASGEVGTLLLAVAVSALAGYAVIAWLLAWLRRRSLAPFACYRLALGALLLLAAG